MLFNKYVNEVKKELLRLNTGVGILMVINQDFTGEVEEYKNSKWANVKNDYIKRNYDMGIKPELTAQHLRDAWFNV
jgi:hypothetical protein